MAGCLLLAAYRRGNKECGLLLIPLMCVPLSTLLDQAAGPFPRFTELVMGLHVRGVGISPSYIALLLLLGGLLAVILMRFIRISRDEEIAAAELEAARTVQQLLIPPSSPATPGFLVESVYLPARQVGGDFFLILPAPDPTADLSLLAVIGDVSGKGLQAAMVVSTIIGGLRMQISRRPAEVLARLNRALTGNVSGFATCCAILLHSDGRAILANAGNPSPYCDGEEVPTLPGLPLGIAPEITYDETTFTLASGSRLSFVSDGVVEATSFPNKELFGFDRTRAISTQSAAAIAEMACAFGIGAPQADDITVLTIIRE
ncbi:PP2C family protein-serine/threonine phosphatase [Granulicella aggregans]|nr:SpoIIE family protein phosphatase [Granulicella aggregans]